MENKTIKYIATICFAIIAILDIIDCIDYFNIWSVISVVGSVLIVIALLKSTPVFSTVGFALWTVNMLISCMTNLSGIIEGWIPLTITLVWIINIVVYVLLLLASIKPKSAKTLGIIATILAIIRLAVLVVRNIAEGYGITAFLILWGVLLAAGAMLLGFTYDGLGDKAESDRTVVLSTNSGKSSLAVQGISEASNVEKIVRLKAFLDDGTITQEEFDEKKKQLLGL